MWCDGILSQRTKATKRVGEVGVDKIWKKGVVTNTGGLHETGGLGTLCQLYCIRIKFMTQNGLLSQWRFYQFCHSFVLILPFQQKKLCFRRLCLQSLNQRYKEYVTFLSHINFLEAHRTHCRNRLMVNYLFISYFSI